MGPPDVFANLRKLGKITSLRNGDSRIAASGLARDWDVLRMNHSLARSMLRFHHPPSGRVGHEVTGEGAVP